MSAVSAVANWERLLSETFELVLTSAHRVRQKEVLHMGVILTNSASLFPLPVNSALFWEESRFPLNASVCVGGLSLQRRCLPLFLGAS